MLGAARASQYAGWWSNRPPSVVFATSSALSYENYQTPAFSWLTDDSANSPDLVSTGNIDLTGYTSLSGYNTRKFTIVLKIYLPWPSGLADNYYGTVYATAFKQTSQTTLFHSITVGTENSGKLYIEAGFNSVTPKLTTTDAYTNYTDRWLTVVVSGSNTPNDFTSWTGTGSSGDNYVRLALYDGITGDLLTHVDQRVSGARPNYSAYGNTLSCDGSVADSMSNNNFASAAQDFRQAGQWIAYGLMFDPFSASDTSWLTTRPSNTIAGCEAWINASFVDTELVSTTYYSVDSEADRYSQADDHVFALGSSAPSTTIYPTNQG